MARAVYFHQNPLGSIAALTEDGDLLELVCARLDQTNSLGNIYSGRVQAINKAAGGAFVDIGGNDAGFLPQKRFPANLHEGAILVIEVDREAEPGKGPRLKLFDHPVREEMKPKLLSAALSRPLQALKSWATEPEVQIHADANLSQLNLPFERYRAAEFIFDAVGLQEVLDSVMAPSIRLPSGGNIIIEPTTSMTTVDVNSGRSQSNSNHKNIMLTNDEAAEMLARHLRLRNIGGLLVVDFLRMNHQRDRDQILSKLKRSVDTDTQIGGFTALGLVDMSRRQRGFSLNEETIRLFTIGRILAALRQQARQSHRRPITLQVSITLIADIDQLMTLHGKEMSEQLGAIDVKTANDFSKHQFTVAMP